MSGPLDGRRAVVTGGSSGIGAAVAHAMAHAGAAVFAVGRDRMRLAAVADAHDHIHPYACDLTASGELEALVAAAERELGGLDVLVHSAGAFATGPLAELRDEDLDIQWALNVRAPLLLTRAALRLLPGEPAGSVVFVSSLAGRLGYPYASAYSATKGAIERLTEALASELGPRVRVNSIAPGHIATPMIAGALEIPTIRDFIGARTPAARLGLPEDVARVAVFLASPAAEFVTGASLAVDGGWSVRGEPVLMGTHAGDKA